MIEEVGGDSVEGDLWLERHQHATELYVTNLEQKENCSIEKIRLNLNEYI
jgi:hypothetical protein